MGDPPKGACEMTDVQYQEIHDVVQRIQHWPAPMRIMLARQVLQRLEIELEPPSTLPRGPTAAEVAAMFKTDKPAPDDETVKQWLDEYRMEKYGK